MQLSILDIIEDTTVDGPEFRTAIYAAGCSHRCQGCHNPGSWDMDKGTWMPVETVLQKILADDFANVTFSGGDPLFRPAAFTSLARQIKQHSHKTIWCYTGFTFEAILKHPERTALLPYLDVLVDGRFVQTQKSEGLLFRGSRNQRLVDVQQSLKEKRVVLYNYNPFLKSTPFREKMYL